jgi:hypothetical protein
VKYTPLECGDANDGSERNLPDIDFMTDIGSRKFNEQLMIAQVEVVETTTEELN